MTTASQIDNTIAHIDRLEAEIVRLRAQLSYANGIIVAQTISFRKHQKETMETAAQEVTRLCAALEIIAGYKQCVDNTLGNVEIARMVLAEQEGK